MGKQSMKTNWFGHLVLTASLGILVTGCGPPQNKTRPPVVPNQTTPAPKPKAVEPAKPETKPDTKAEVKPEVKTEPSGETKTDPAGEKKTEPSGEKKTEPEPKPEPKAESQPKAEPQPEPAPEKKPESTTTNIAPTDLAMKFAKSPFGKTPDGKEANLFTITNAKGTTLKLTDYGAAIVAVETPDKDGKAANLNWGFDSAEGFAKNGSYFGVTVGRFGNRIAKGKFKIGETEYSLAINNDPNSLHGGKEGFNRKLWSTKEIKSDKEAGVEFKYTSPDGEEGYPGALSVTVVYSLTADNELKIDYTATTDKDTVVNLTNHCYWNLSGVGSGNVLDHDATIEADKVLAVDGTLIPTGEMTDVKGTLLDFTSPHKLGERIEQLKKDAPAANGYDHCYVLRNQDSKKLALAAKVKDPKSGRVMEVWTTEPGVQLYTGNHLKGDPSDAGCPQHGGFCLETQHYPDSPNRPAFPTTLLKPGETYRHTTVHKFSVEK